MRMRLVTATVLVATLAGCRSASRTMSSACRDPGDPRLPLDARPLADSAGVILGTVRAAPDARLVRASLGVVEVRRGASADEAGAFRLDSLAPGRHVLSTRSTGYRTRTDTIVVLPGAGLRLVVPLQRAFAEPTACLVDVLVGG